MAQKKIATGVKVLIKVAEFESIEIAKYSETTIEFDSQENMVAQEEEHNADVVNDLIRSMRELPDRLGKKTNAVTKIEASIEGAIPKWLNENPIPNIADGVNLPLTMKDKSDNKAIAKNKTKSELTEDLDLGDDDETATEETEVVEEFAEVEAETNDVPEAVTADANDLFSDDDDLFS